MDLDADGDPIPEDRWFSSKSTWARMAVSTLPGQTGTPLVGYRRSEHHEEQLGFRELQQDIYDDRVYYNNARAQEVNVGLNPLWSTDPDGGDVRWLAWRTGADCDDDPAGCGAGWRQACRAPDPRPALREWKSLS